MISVATRPLEEISTWKRRTIGVLTLGGSSTGAVVLIAELITGISGAANLAIFAVFLTIFCWGIFAGMATLENQENWVGYTWLFWAIQIPEFTSPSLSYAMYTGARFAISLAEGFNLNFNWGLGAQFSFYLSSNYPYEFGVNIVALIIFYVLFLQEERPSIEGVTSESPPGDA